MTQNNTTYRLSWQQLKKDWPLWLLMVTGLLLGLYVKPQLPDQVPIHWNIRGQVDGYATSTYAVWFSPLLTMGLYLMLILLPYLDPKRANYVRFTSTYQYIKILLVLFFTGLHTAVLAAGLGYQNVPSLFIRIGMPLLFIFFGNVMGQIRHNYFVGIRTPWTIASPEVWRLTHRSAAKIWVLSGLIGLVAAFLPGEYGFVVLFGALTFAALVPAVQSYFLFRRLG